MRQGPRLRYMMVMVVVMMMRRRGSSTGCKGGVHLLPRPAADQLDRMIHDSAREERIHVFFHGLDAARKRHHERVFKRPRDRPRQCCERGVLQRHRQHEVHEPGCCTFEQRRYRLQ